MEDIRTLVLAGGRIHDFKTCGPIVREILEADSRFKVTYMEDDIDVFVEPGLNEYDVLVFYYTVGEITRAQKNGLLEWVASGKGFVGIHSAADSFRDCPEYRAMVGGHFETHPHYRDYQVCITDPEHPITKGVPDCLPQEFFVKDEMYVTSYDRRNHILAQALWKDAVVPVAWVKPWGEGRVFWLGLGHDGDACKHEVFAELLKRGTVWAGRPEDERNS